MQKLTFNSIGRILDKRTRRKLFILAIARVAATSLDLVGLAGVAVLAASFSSIASGEGGSREINLPLLGSMALDETAAVLVALGILAVFLLKSVFSIWLNFLTALTVASFEIKLAGQLAGDFFSVERLGMPGKDDSVSDFQNRAIFATRAISSYANSRLTLIAESSLLLVMLTIFVVINPLATLAMFFGMGFLLFLLNRVLGGRIHIYGERIVEGNRESLQSIRDLFGARREALASGALEVWLSRIITGKRRSAEGAALTYVINSLPRYIVETTLIAGVVAFIAGVVIFSDLATQSVTIGVFLAGGLRVIASLLPLQSAFNTMQASAAQGAQAFDDLIRIRDTPVKPDTECLHSPSSGVSFAGVAFTYPGGSKPVLEGINLEIGRNQKVAIVGPSGAGKSTLLDLAAGFVEPSVGKVTRGEVSARQALVAQPGSVGIVVQRTHLVTGSILENVSLIEDSATNKDKVMQSLVRAGLGHFTAPENWFELQIRPDSGQLSGGEIQRLGLARALYRDPKILFLDEATSALDAETEAEITKVLQSLKNEMTVVLIAHRLSTVMHADKIIYLDQGKIVAEGTFSELKSKVPDFAKAVELMDLSEK